MWYNNRCMWEETAARVYLCIEQLATFTDRLDVLAWDQMNTWRVYAHLSNSDPLPARPKS